MDKLLNENKEPQDIISREHSLCDGIEVNINLKDLYNKKQGKVRTFKKLHQSCTDSTFVDIDAVREIVIGDTFIEFNDMQTDADEHEPIEEIDPTIDLIDLAILVEESSTLIEPDEFKEFKEY